MSERAVTRGFLGLDRRGWPGAIAVALVAAAVAVGLPVLNELVSADRVLPPGSVVDVGMGVSFTAADGWSLNADETNSLRYIVLIHKGALSLEVEARSSDGSLTDEYARLAEEIRGSPGVQLFNDATTFTTDGGLTGIAGSYSGPEAEGRFAVLEAGGTVVRVVARGPADAMANDVDEVEQMVQTLRIEAP
jgi:hypothetical protein